jgi:hypothetical protein
VRRAQRSESSRGREGAASSRQSGDLEGLSRVEQADSESIDELVEEGEAEPSEFPVQRHASPAFLHRQMQIRRDSPALPM